MHVYLYIHLDVSGTISFFFLSESEDLITIRTRHRRHAHNPYYSAFPLSEAIIGQGLSTNQIFSSSKQFDDIITCFTNGKRKYA